jgi:hypothetical protein
MVGYPRMRILAPNVVMGQLRHFASQKSSELFAIDPP